MTPVGVRRRCALVMFVLLVTTGCCVLHERAYADVSPKRLRVIDLHRLPDSAELSSARAALRAGSAIVRIVGATKEEVARMLEVQLPEVDASTKRSNTLTPQTDKTGDKLMLQAVAVYLDEHGTFRMLETFAARNSTESAWRGLFEKWTATEISRAAGLLVGDPAPPAQAWTTLSVATVQASVTGGLEENNISVYRLNTIDPANDYYMVYTVPTVQPNWDGSCDGYDHCGWHTYSRDLQTSVANAAMPEHGPTGTIGTSSTTFSIGAGVGPTGPGANATFTANWTQQDVTTTDLSTTAAGGWHEDFGTAWIRCNPAFGRVPATSSGTFFSRQGAIFRVPGGTTSIQPVAEADADFCSYAVDSIGFDYSNIRMNYTVLLGAPVLSGYPMSMTIPAGATMPLLVSAYIPNSTQGLQWNITSNHATSWLSVPSGNTFSTSEVVPVSVAAGTAPGLQGTLSVDTTPPFAAPSVTSGPLLINVTVGEPKLTSRAGVLLVGGENAFRKIANAVFYDMNAKQVVPVGQPSVPRYLHTATQLPSGEVLVAGGASDIKQAGVMTPLAAMSELYEPASASFKPTGSLLFPRSAHSAVLLPDGKVLIVGGEDQQSAPVRTAELYDPVSGTFTSAGTMNTVRSGGAAATLISAPGEAARVLVYGGYVSGLQASTEIWSEATRSFSPGPPMLADQATFPAPVESRPGRFEIVSGFDSIHSSSPGTQILTTPSTFEIGPPLNVARQSHTLTALANGSGVLVTGGAASPTAEMKTANQWAMLSGSNPCPGSAGCMVAERNLHTATLLPDGTVFVAGGKASTGLALGSSEIFDPTKGAFAPGPTMPTQALQTDTFVSTSEISLFAAPSPVTFGQKVKLVAVVTVGYGAASGHVVFLDNGLALGTVPITAGNATLETTSLTVGTHKLTAQYTGDPVNQPATSSPATVAVASSSTAVSLTSSINPSSVGQTVSFVAHVLSTNGTETGSITFKDGATTLAIIPLNNGAAAYPSSTLAAGDHFITAVYEGDASHAPNTSAPLTQKVVQGATVTTLQIRPGAVPYGKTISLIAAVSGTGAITGSVLFKDGNVSLGTVNLMNSRATLPVSSFTVGSHLLTATYSGDPTHLSSTSPRTPASVTQAVPTIKVTSSKNPSSFGQPVTFLATLSGSGVATPSGTVSFGDGATTIGAPQAIVNGSASISRSSLAAGPHAISAAYSGDSNYTSAASTAVQQTVTGAATQTILRATPNPSQAGQSVLFQVAVTALQGTPSGLVRIFDGKTQIEVVALTNGTGSVSTTALAVGSHAIRAVYAGDAIYSGSTSSSLTQVVNKGLVSTTLKLTSRPNPSVTGGAVVFTTIATSSSGPVPTGSVTLSEGSKIYGSATLVAGQAVVSVSSIPVGIHEIRATYGGDQNHTGATSAPVVQTVH